MWAKKELNSDAQEKSLDADSGEEEDAPEDDFLGVLDISDDHSTGADGWAKTTPIIKKWGWACDREPEMDPTKGLVGGLTSHLLLT